MARQWWWRWRWEVSGLAAGVCCGSTAVAECSKVSGSYDAQVPGQVMVLEPGLKLGRQERLVAVRRDALLGTRWGVVTACDHPEWPARVVALTGFDGPAQVALLAGGTARTAAVRVRAGEHVVLWRQDGVARIESAGVTEESGVEGQQIRVRLVRPAGSAGGEGSKGFVVGVVRGPGNVEIVQ